MGLSLATLMARNHSVTAVDVVPEKVEMINRRESPIQDEYIEKYFAQEQLDLVATLDAAAAYRDAEFVVIAAPTNYDPQKNFFDTSAVEVVISKVLEVNKDAVMVIASPDGTSEICDRPNDGLAKGGSGDVLAGIIASLLTQRLEPYRAAVAGVLLHSLAAAKGREVLGAASMLPSDLPAYLSSVYLDLRKE